MGTTRAVPAWSASSCWRRDTNSGSGVASSGRAARSSMAVRTDGGVVGAGPKATGAAPHRQGVKEGGHLSSAHWSSSSPIFVAICRARCWRTLALLTLISMVWAASLIEDASRNRSSRIRR